MLSVFIEYKKKYNNMSLQSKAALWFVVCNFIVKAINFISAPILTSLLSTDQYGIISVYNAYQQILLIFATFELYYGAYNKGYVEHRDSLKEFTCSLVILSNIITIIFFAIALLFRKYFIQYTGLGIGVMLLTFMMFFFQPAYYCWIAKKRFQYRYREIVVVTVLLSLSTFGIPIFFMILTSLTAEVEIMTTLIVSIIFYLCFYIKLINDSYRCIDLKELKKYWKFCIGFQTPLVIHSLSFLILGQADRIMISEMVDASCAGIYSVSYTIAALAIVFQTSINQSYQPFRYKCLKEKRYNDFSESVDKIILKFGVIVILFSIIAPEIVNILFADEYMDAIIIIPAICASAFFMLLYTLFVDVETYFEKTSYVMYASLVCAILNIVLNYFAINSLGYQACGLTTLISYIAFAIIHFMFMQRTCRLRGIEICFIDARKVVFISLVLIFVESIIALLYKEIFYRYVIFIVLLLLYLKCKKMKRGDEE